jgi:hypothetical protein
MGGENIVNQSSLQLNCDLELAARHYHTTLMSPADRFTNRALEHEAVMQSYISSTAAKQSHYLLCR